MKSKPTDQKIIQFAIVVLLLVAGAYLYLSKTNQTQVAMQQAQVSKITKSYETFADPSTGFSVQYSSLYQISDINGTKYLRIAECKDGEYCFPNNNYISIEIASQVTKSDVDQRTTQLNKEMKCKDIFLNITGTKITGTGVQRALRCEFSEVPKQAPGGYLYLLNYNNNLYTLTEYQQGWETELMRPNNKLDIISADKYDPALDSIMKTVHFTK